MWKVKIVASLVLALTKIFAFSCSTIKNDELQNKNEVFPEWIELVDFERLKIYSTFFQCSSIIHLLVSTFWKPKVDNSNGPSSSLYFHLKPMANRVKVKWNIIKVSNSSEIATNQPIILHPMAGHFLTLYHCECSQRYWDTTNIL